MKTITSGLIFPFLSNNLDFNASFSFNFKNSNKSFNLSPFIEISLIGSFESPLNTAKYFNLIVGIMHHLKEVLDSKI
ncbi:MAG: hypothetical protein QE159_06550 [Candidatus Verstraetearchaeota archaeon]|nr:hypothetical protein [Candidatus Verstraetearchaeota archaeon]